MTSNDLSELKAAAEAATPGRWLLVKRGLYWRPDSQGYTGVKDEAGRYSDKEKDDRVGDEVTAILYDEAPRFSPRCYPDVKWKVIEQENDSLIARVERLESEARERVASFMIAHGFATGHGDTIDALLSELGGQVDERLAKTKRLEDALEDERRKFQQETLRTSEQAQMLQKWWERAEYHDHKYGPWSRGCTWCELARDTKILLGTPINARAALEGKP